MTAFPVDGVALRLDEPLARHLAWRTGGRCDAWMVVHRRGALADALAWCRDEQLPHTILGAGTRSVARDGCLSGAVIRLGNDFAQIARDGATWTVGAAVPVPALALGAAEAGFGGVEDLTAVPGSLGAALALDPGPGEGWGSIVESVTYFHRGKERRGTYAAMQDAGKVIVLGAVLRLVETDPERAIAKSLAHLRGEGKGMAVPPSSWVQPPKRISIREVLERAGLRDVRLREVAIPAVAPEMLVNLGGGTARDLQLLHQSALERTVRECGVELQSRVCWMGRAS